MLRLPQTMARRSFATHRQPLNRARRGLYGGKRVIFGNNVSHSKRRTRRSCKPNVQQKNLTRCVFHLMYDSEEVALYFLPPPPMPRSHTPSPIGFDKSSRW